MVMMSMGNQDRDIQAFHLVAIGEEIPNQLLAGGDDARTRIQKDGVIQEFTWTQEELPPIFSVAGPGTGMLPRTPRKVMVKS